MTATVETTDDLPIGSSLGESSAIDPDNAVSEPPASTSTNGHVGQHCQTPSPEAEPSVQPTLEKVSIHGGTKDGMIPGNTSTVTSVKELPVRSTSTTSPVKKSSERDSVNALLSLGRDLENGEPEKNGEDALTPAGNGTASPDRQLQMLPSADNLGPPPKKRQKQEKGKSNAGGYEYPPDFWYWLPTGESIGDWDVLCGRGGESNNFIGNKKYRRVVNERKEAYRTIPVKQRKAKTAFVRNIVQHVNNCGGRFIDLDEATGNYFVVTMEKARKKTSQALRETKLLKWLEIEPNKERKTSSNKSAICPYCKKPGHKTKIAKACLLHHEWLDPNADKAQSLPVEADDTRAVQKEKVSATLPTASPQMPSDSAARVKLEASVSSSLASGTTIPSTDNPPVNTGAPAVPTMAPPSSVQVAPTPGSMTDGTSWYTAV